MSDNLEYNHRVRFGGNRNKALKRDSYRCVICGMSRAEHKIKWNRDLAVDHKDGRGRSSKIKNHLLSNLQTLCLICHTKKDAKNRNWRTLENHPRAKLKNKQVIRIRELCKSDKYQFLEIAKMYKVHPTLISQISRNIKWKTLKVVK